MENSETTQTRFDFVKEVKFTDPDHPMFYTKKDGFYVPNSLRGNEQEAYSLYIKLLNGESIENSIEILDTKFI